MLKINLARILNRNKFGKKSTIIQNLTKKYKIYIISINKIT